MRTFTTLQLWVLAVATVVLVVACDRVNLTAPTGSTISLSVERNVLPLNGQTTVTAVVTESAGTAVQNGTFVTFQTTVGSFNPPQAQTTDGVAITTFLAGGSSGRATITAFSGGARSSNSSATTISIGAAAAAGAISMSASPTSVSQSGGTVTISAVVFDADNNPLPGVNVQFVTGTGTLNPTIATTDSSGIARTQLTTTQSTNVEAIAGAAKGNVRVEVSSAPSVTIGDPAPPPVAGQPTSFTVTATSGNTSAPRQVQTLEVNFGDGAVETRSNVTGQAAFTHTYRDAGAYTITARAVDVAGNTGIASKGIVVGFAPQPTVGLKTSDPAPNVNEVFTMTVTPAPSSPTGAPIRSVIVRTNDGTVLYSGGAGTAEFPVQFGSPGPRTITATATDAAGQSASSTITVIVQP